MQCRFGTEQLAPVYPNGQHTRSVVAVGAWFSYWPLEHGVRPRQRRSEVAVGAALWYWVDVLHTVTGAHTLDCAPLQPLWRYEPAGQSRQAAQIRSLVAVGAPTSYCCPTVHWRTGWHSVLLDAEHGLTWKVLGTLAQDKHRAQVRDALSAHRPGCAAHCTAVKHVPPNMKWLASHRWHETLEVHSAQVAAQGVEQAKSAWYGSLSSQMPSALRTCSTHCWLSKRQIRHTPWRRIVSSNGAPKPRSAHTVAAGTSRW